VALERILRFLQAVIQILLAYPFVQIIALAPFLSSPKEPAEVAPVLSAVRSQIALGRRFFRFFRFLDNFAAANRVWTTITTPPPALAVSSAPEVSEAQSAASKVSSPAELWLDLLSRTFNGMYLLLESSTIVESFSIPGFTVWGASAPAVNVEAQRFWFLSLVCGIMAAVVRLTKLSAFAAVPPTGEGYGIPAQDGDDSEKTPLQKETARLAAMIAPVKRAREQRKARFKKMRAEAGRLSRRLLADVLDLTVPGIIIGWVPVEHGTMSIAMLGSTILTGWEVWDRVGSEMMPA
jgi:F0F1-type ATP synthase assembly protein I